MLCFVWCMLSFLSTSQIEPFLRDFFGHVTIQREVLPRGLLNQNSLLTVGDRKFVLKVYRRDMPLVKVETTHRVMEFVSGYNIPIALPLVTQMIEEHVVVLYPFIVGVHPAFYRNSFVRLGNMGEMLGRIHEVLDLYRSDLEKPLYEKLTGSWDVPKAIEKIDLIRESLKQYPKSVQEKVGHILQTLEQLISDQTWEIEPFLQLPIRFIQGDFHAANILMRGSEIVSVLDWEKTGWNFRGFELMRSVLFNCRRTVSELSWPHVETYLKAYREHGQLNELEKELVFECGLRNFLFSFWAIEQYLGGRKELWPNIVRRMRMAENLVKCRVEYAEKVAGFLR